MSTVATPCVCGESIDAMSQSGAAHRPRLSIDANASDVAMPNHAIPWKPTSACARVGVWSPRTVAGRAIQNEFAARNPST